MKPASAIRHDDCNRAVSQAMRQTNLRARQFANVRLEKGFMRMR